MINTISTHQIPSTETIIVSQGHHTTQLAHRPGYLDVFRLLEAAQRTTRGACPRLLDPPSSLERSVGKRLHITHGG